MEQMKQFRQQSMHSWRFVENIDDSICECTILSTGFRSDRFPRRMKGDVVKILQQLGIEKGRQSALHVRSTKAQNGRATVFVVLLKARSRVKKQLLGMVIKQSLVILGVMLGGYRSNCFCLNVYYAWTY